MARKYLLSLGIIASLLLVGCDQLAPQEELIDDSDEVVEAESVQVESTGDVDQDLLEIEREIEELDLDEDFPELDVSEIQAE